MSAETYTTETIHEAVSYLSPSAKLVLLVLKHNEALTPAGLAEKTRLSPRTVRYATSQLEEEGVVSSEIHIPDARQRLYYLDPAFQQCESD